jgi:hypothetical protein
MSDNELRICDLPHGFVVAGEKLDNLNKRVVTDASHFVISHAAGEWGMGAYTGGRRAPTHDEIAQLAYCLYALRGRQDGHHLEDCLRAEQELVNHYA